MQGTATGTLIGVRSTARVGTIPVRAARALSEPCETAAPPEVIGVAGMTEGYPHGGTVHLDLESIYASNRRP